MWDQAASRGGVKDELNTLVGRHYRTGEPIRITWDASMISEVESVGTLDPVRWVAPGLVDCQVNGYRGIDFNDVPLTADEIVQVTNAMWRDGVTSFMPTIISHSFKDTVGLAGAWASEIPSVIESSIIGLHLEGPFISPEEGPRGAHDAQWIGPPNLGLIERCQESSGGLVRLVTISPHWDGSADFVKAVTALGITVAIGHTNANASQIRLAVDNGATLSTHLGNGTHTFLPRHRNYLWEQLAEDRLWASVIGDGFHLPGAVMKVILREKENRVYLISDAVALTGGQPGYHRTSVGGNVYLHEDGKLSVGIDSDILAGAATPLKDGVAQMVSSGLGDLGTIWDLASCRPATFWRRETSAGLAVGAPADIVLFEYDSGHINIRQTIKGGRVVYDDL